MLPLWYYHTNGAAAVAAAVAAASTAASPTLGNNCPNYDHKAEMRPEISLALQVMEAQQQ
jgi:hypothetical protein